MSEEKNIIDYINKIISSLKPVTYEEFNKKFEFKELADLEKLDCVITSDNKISTISLLVSIVEFLTDEKIAFIVDDETNIITGIKKIYNK